MTQELANAPPKTTLCFLSIVRLLPFLFASLLHIFNLFIALTIIMVPMFVEPLSTKSMAVLQCELRKPIFIVIAMVVVAAVRQPQPSHQVQVLRPLVLDRE